MDLSGQTAAASVVSTTRIRSRARSGFFEASKINSAGIFLRFVWYFNDSGSSVWIPPYTLNYKHNCNPTSELDSQFMSWKYFKYLENQIQFGLLGKHFRMIICCWIQLRFIGLDWVDGIQNLNSYTQKCVVGTAKRAEEKYYTFSYLRWCETDC